MRFKILQNRITKLANAAFVNMLFSHYYSTKQVANNLERSANSTDQIELHKSKIHAKLFSNFENFPSPYQDFSLSSVMKLLLGSRFYNQAYCLAQKEEKAPYIKPDFSKPYNPSDFVHGLLSSHAYRNSQQWQDAIFEDAHKNAKYNPSLKNWRILKIYNKETLKEDVGDYYSVLYVNDEDGHLVLAHRGTDIAGSLKGKNDSLNADFVEVLNRRIGKHTYGCYLATSDAVEVIKNQDYAKCRLSFTGHSLGGFLAEASIVFSKYELDYNDIKAVVFDSPGYLPHAEKMTSSNIRNSETQKNLATLPIVTYLSVPNFVNVCNPHIGTAYRLFPKIDLGEEIAYLKKTIWYKYFKDYIDNGQEAFIYAIIAILGGHSLDLLLEEFDPKTGKPKPGEWKEILNWPALEHVVNPNVGNNLRDAAIDQVTGTKTLSQWLFNKGIKKVSPDILGNYITYFSLASVLKSYKDGNTDIKQIVETWRHLDTSQDKEGVEKILSNKDKFDLRYKGNYVSRDVDLYQIITTKQIGSIPNYLNKLKQLHAKEIDKKFPTYIEELKQIKEASAIKPYTEGQLVIKTSKFTVEKIFEKMKYILRDEAALHQFNSLKHARAKYLCNELMNPSYKEFIGRDEKLKEIAYNISDVSLVFIAGLPGIGKSSLTRKYADKFLEERDDRVVVMFDASSAEKIILKYDEIGELLDLPAKATYGSNDVFIRAIHSQLSIDPREILLIFDGLNDKDFLLKLTESQQKNIKILISTRNSADIPDGIRKQYYQIKLEYFTQEEAEEYITKNLERPIDEALNSRLAKISGLLPHTLKQIVAYLNGKDLENPEYQLLSIENFVQRVEKGQIDIHKDLTKLLLDILAKHQGAGELAWKILQYSCVLDNNFVHQDILKQLFSVEDRELMAAIKILQNLSFMDITYEFSSGDVGVSMHQLTSKNIRNYIDLHANSENVIRMDEIVNHLLKVLDEEMPAISLHNWKANNKIRIAAHQLEHIVKFISQDYDPLLLSKVYEHLARYINVFTFEIQKSIKYAKNALELIEKIPDHEKTIEHREQIIKLLGILSSSYKQLGTQEGYKQSVEILKRSSDDMQKYNLFDYNTRKETLASNDHDIALSLRNVRGTQIENINFLKESLYYLDRAYKMFLELFLGKDHIKLSNCLDLYGGIYQTLSEYVDKQENLELAASYHKKCLDMRKKLYPNDENPLIGGVLINFSNDYIKLGGRENLETALHYLLEAREILNKTGHKVFLSNCLHRLGRVYGALGGKQDLLQAKQAFEDELMLRQSLGEEQVNKSLVHIYKKLIWVHKQLIARKPNDSEQLFVDALNYLTKLVERYEAAQQNGEIQKLSQAYLGIAELCLCVKSPEKAKIGIEYLENFSTILSAAINSKDNLKIKAWIYDKKGELYRNAADFESSINSHKIAIDLAIKMEEELLEAAFLNNLSISYNERYESKLFTIEIVENMPQLLEENKLYIKFVDHKVEYLLQKNDQIYNGQINNVAINCNSDSTVDHSHIMPYLKKLISSVLIQNGLLEKDDLLESEQALKRAIEIFNGKEIKKEWQANFWINLAKVYEKMGKFDLTHECYLKALEIRENINPGVDHVQKESITHAIGDMLFLQGRSDEAFGYFQKSYQMKGNLFGRDSDQVKNFCSFMERMYSDKNFDGSGFYASEQNYWNKYSKIGLERLLELRIKGIPESDLLAKVKISVPGNFWDGSYESLLKILPQEFSNGTYCLALNLFAKHWVGIVIEKSPEEVVIHYQDPEQNPIPEDLKAQIMEIIANSGLENTCIIEQKLTAQNSNNCGPEVIENFMLHLTGCRLPQEEAVKFHSLLLEEVLLSEASEDYQSLETLGAFSRYADQELLLCA